MSVTTPDPQTDTPLDPDGYPVDPDLAPDPDSPDAEPLDRPAQPNPEEDE